MLKNILNKIKGSKFCRYMLIYIGVVFAIFAIAISVLCLFLGAYERNLPENVASEYVSGIDGESLRETVEAALGKVSEFEDRETVLAEVSLLTDKDIELTCAKKVKEYTSSRPVFSILFGDKEIGRVELEKASKRAAFGLTAWKVKSSELYRDAVFGEKTEYTVTVPTGAGVTVNGRPLGEEFRTQTAVQYEGLVFGDKAKLSCDTYLLPKLYRFPKVVVAEGDRAMIELDKMTLSGTNIDWFLAEESCYMLSVPSEAYVTVDGSLLPTSFSVKTEAVSDVGDFEKGAAEKLPEISYYRILKTDAPPTVKALLSGKELAVKTEGMTLSCAYTDEFRHTLNVTVPQGATLQINGVEVGNEYKVSDEESVGYSSLSALGKYLGELPASDTYIVGGLYLKPEYSVELDGKTLELSALREEGRTVIAEYYGFGSLALEQEQSETAKEFASAYINYTVNGSRNLDETNAAVLALMQYGSPGYKKIQDTKKSFYWANSSAYTIDKMTPRNFVPLGENGYFCCVDFSVTLKGYKYTKLYEGTISLVYVKQDGRWLAAEIYIDSTNVAK